MKLIMIFTLVLFISTSMACATNAGEEDYNQGYQYEMDGEYTKALESYSNAIKKEPENSRYYRTRGSVYERLGDAGHQLADYQKVIELAPDDFTSYLLRGAAYARQGKYELALVDFKAARERYRDGKRSYYNDYDFYTATEPYYWSLEDFNQLIDLEPTNINLYAARIFSYRVNYFYEIPNEKILKDVEQVIRLAPYESIGYLLRAVHIEDEAEKLASFEKGISLDPTDYSGYELRGNYYHYGKSEYEKAMIDYQKALQVSSYLRYYTPILIRVFKDARKYEEGERFFTEQISKNPKDFQTYLSRSQFYKEFEKYELAILDLDQAISLAPKDEQGHWWTEQLRLIEKVGNDDLLLKKYEEVIILYPDNTRWYQERSLFYYERGNYQLALVDQEKSMENQKSENNWGDKTYLYLDQREYQYRGELYYRVGEYEKALVDFTRALELQKEYRDYQKSRNSDAASVGIIGMLRLPIDSNIYYQRAKVYYQMKNYGKAQKEIQKALEASSYDGDSFGDLYRLSGLVHEGLGKKEDALRYYREYLSLGKKEDYVYWRTKYFTKIEQEEYRKNREEIQAKVEKFKNSEK